MASSKTEERRRKILSIVHTGLVNVEELSLHFGVSESTIRRDLFELANDGRIVRTYGGAALLNLDKREHSLDERQTVQRNQKDAIARVAAMQVRDGESLILDAGTTTCALARQLRGRRDLHVVTNNIMALTTLSSESGISLTMLGGSVRKMSMGTVGPLAEMALSRISADKAFLGADGLVAGRGLCEASQEQAALKEKMMDQAGAVYVLADSSKLGYAGQNAWTPLTRPWTLITDASATQEQLAPFYQLSNVTVIVANGGSVLKSA
jgi:DeoR/GlpR family transcriptional regulator of sugar metabolism